MLNNDSICSSEVTETEAKSLEIVMDIATKVHSSCIKCAMKLNIPNILHKNANPIMSVSDLIAALPNLNPSKISFIPILMRVLVHFGIFNYHQEQGDSSGYSLTDVGRLLVENDLSNKGSFFLLTQHLLKTIDSLGDWLRDDIPTAFETAHGKSFWNYCAENPEFSRIFDDLMVNDSRLISRFLASDNCKNVFEGLTSLVDVGGGTGIMAMAIAKAFPNLKCTVLDLPHVIGDPKEIENVAFVVGNMFDKIPQANAILLKWILHDWNDQDCVKLLKKCKESIPSKEKGGKVLIIDIVMDDNYSNEQLVQSQHVMDFIMRINFASKERTEKEWEKLFVDAGFREYKIITSLGLKSLIEIYP